MVFTDVRLQEIKNLEKYFLIIQIMYIKKNILNLHINIQKNMMLKLN